MMLFVYKGEFSLPSVDLECLRVLTYAKLANVGNIEVHYDRSPFRSKSGFLPYLVDGSEQYCGYDKIVNYFKKEKGYVLDDEKSEQSISFIRENLYPFFMYQLFGNPQNSDESRSLYATRTPFPFNFFYPYKYISKTNEVCQALASFSLEDPIDAHDTVEIEAKAKKCLNWISEKLNCNEYFINGSPSEVDATLYAYLAIILKFQLPNNQLQVHTKQCENLVKYVHNMTMKLYKSEEVFESEKAKAKSQKQEQKVFTGQEDEDPPGEVRKRYVLSGLVAATAMILYGHLAGIFSITLAEKFTNEDPTFSQFDNITGDDEE